MLAAGCLGSAQLADGGADAQLDVGAGDQAAPDLRASDGAAPDAAPLRDLAGADIAGLVDCFGVAVCDPSMQFCIRYYDGSQAQPGKLVSGPACYEPSDTCANMNQNMDCGCIQNDMTLGMGCEGACVDHGDGTYDCFPM